MQRKVKYVVNGQDAVDGAGVKLRRVIGIRDVEDFDPFLMLDGFDSENPEDYIKGFPFHPHRGIETVTYLVDGIMEHQDSLGNKGVIAPLGCQWMTAGSGIIHQEMPKPSKRMLGAQLWVNLPKKDKMIEPAYRDITGEDVGIVEEDNATVRVLSGEYKGTKGAVHGESLDVLYLDIDLKPGENFVHVDTPNDETLFIYIFDGSVIVGEGEEVSKRNAVLFEASDEVENDEVVIKAGVNGARFALLAAKPLGEPVAWGGPIVMNTRAELNEAFYELENGTFIKHENPVVK